MIALYLAGCTLVLPAEEPRDSGELDSGETGDAGAVDSGETGLDTAGETAVDTGDIDTGADTSVDTGDTSDTALHTSVDTADSGTATPTDYIAASGATMIYLPAGSFSMGSGLGDSSGAYTDHDVTLSHDFYLVQTETTRGEWESDPSNTGWTYWSVPTYPCTGTAADCPADTMTWYEAAIYANWLSTEERLTECYLADGTDMAAAYLADPYSCPGYRLPTEAEWVYAVFGIEHDSGCGLDVRKRVLRWHVCACFLLPGGERLGLLRHERERLGVDE